MIRETARFEFSMTEVQILALKGSKEFQSGTKDADSCD